MKFNKLYKAITIATLSAIMLSGCASNSSALNYDAPQAQRMQKVYNGVIISMRPVTINGQDNPLIATAGTAVGGLVGSEIGGGNGKLIAGIVSGVLGGLATNLLVNQATTQNGVEIFVKVENSDQAIAVVQKNDQDFHVGQSVYLLSDGQTYRIIPRK